MEHNTEVYSTPQLYDEYKKLNCRYCNDELGDPFLELSPMALANSFITKDDLEKDEFICPLSIVYCPTCHLVQLSHVVPASKMFDHYLYVSSTTKTFQKHFLEYAQTLSSLFDQNKGVAVDIGSNDGLLVDCYAKSGFKALGVEPAKNLATDANKKGFETINRYFDQETVNQVLAQVGKVNVISGNNVFAHIDDIHDVLKNVKQLLNEEGVFVIEYPYLVTMLEDMLFDMIYHEHLSYISITALTYVLNKFDLEIFKIQSVSSHGGSLRTFIKRKSSKRSIGKEVQDYIVKEEKIGCNKEETYLKFGKRVYKIRQNMREFIDTNKNQGKKICGYGAPAKGNTIINFCGLTSGDIDYIVDDNPLKQNTFAPGSHLPVVSSDMLKQDPCDVLIIFAWNFSKEILEKIKPNLSKNTQYIVPLPEPLVV